MDFSIHLGIMYRAQVPIGTIAYVYVPKTAITYPSSPFPIKGQGT